MISYKQFTTLLKQELLNPLHLIPQGYDPSHSTNIKDFVWNTAGHYWNDGGYSDTTQSNDFNGHVVWCHEEPLNHDDLYDLANKNFHNPAPNWDERDYHDVHIPSIWNLQFFHINFNVFANSEKSDLKKEWLKNSFPKYSTLYDWYFFFHGFAALDWYRDYKFLHNPAKYKIDKVFMCLNHLIEDKRSYRLHLLAELKKRNLFKFGLITCPLLSKSIIKKEINNTYLQQKAKTTIISNLYNDAEPLIIDNINYNDASASIPNYIHQSLWSIVTETVYFEPKLHLTEKIFKPIVSKKPFILVAAPKNLEYLKSYGFKTFDRWIDESYDLELDHEKRILMIVEEIEKLCKLSDDDLNIMNLEMQEILEYNHQHFYNNFKIIIVDELLDNFKKCVTLYNTNLSERFRLPIERVNFDHVRNVLLNC